VTISPASAPLARFARRALRACAVSVLLASSLAALADDYSEVNRLVQAKQYGEALSRADQYLGTRPRDPQMRFLRGVILADMGKRAEALEAYTQLTQEYPELPEPYNNLAVLYAQAGDFDKARDALEGAVRANPGYAVAHENLGDVYARLAAQSYAKAGQIDPAGTSAPAKLALVRQLLSGAAAKR
jgi:Flp pilus assembly protein TadD